MTDLWIERALWIGAVVCLVLGASGLRGGGRPASPTAPRAVIPTLSLRLPTSDSLIDAASIAAELDLFRSARAPVETEPLALTLGVNVPLPPSRKPALVLRGLVGGRSLEALVEGIPGTSGAVLLRAGETVAGITLRVVRRDTAILVAKDTTWKLTIRRF